MRKKIAKIFHIFLVVVLVFFPCGRTEGMQSSNYIIEKDSINFAGSEESESANYKMSDTAGEIGTGEGQCSGASCNYLLGGYRQTDATGGGVYTISISTPADISLSPAIGGVSGGVGDGNVTWKVTTDNPNGYQLDIKASTSPAMQSGSYIFADYTPAAADPDYDWSVGTSDSEFGYSVEGTHTVSKFLDNGSACATGSGNVSDKCWLGLSTSDASIATSASPNSPTGTDTVVKFRAEAGNQRMQEDGDYSSTIVVTAVAL